MKSIGKRQYGVIGDDYFDSFLDITYDEIPAIESTSSDRDSGMTKNRNDREQR